MMTTENAIMPSGWYDWSQALRNAWTRHHDAQDAAQSALARLRGYLPTRLDTLLLDCDSTATSEMIGFAALLLARLVEAYPDAASLAAWLLTGEDNGEPRPD